MLVMVDVIFPSLCLQIPHTHYYQIDDDYNTKDKKLCQLWIKASREIKDTTLFRKKIIIKAPYLII